MSDMFEVGRFVQCVDPGGNLVEGLWYEIVRIEPDEGMGTLLEVVGPDASVLSANRFIPGRIPGQWAARRFRRSSPVVSALDTAVNLACGQPTAPAAQAARYDAGKPQLDYLLTFPTTLAEFAKVCQAGATKYARGNYLKGAPWSQSVACTMRHLLKWWNGESVDAESGCHHLAHVVWNTLRLCEEAMTARGTDDRISYDKTSSEESK